MQPVGSAGRSGEKQEVKENPVPRFEALSPTSACSFTFHLGFLTSAFKAN